jgi:hypothetical protein
MIRYLNTDLDIVSAQDLTPFAAALEAKGLLLLHLGRGDDGCNQAIFEADASHNSPEETMRAMLDIVEALPPSERAVWDAAALRLLNIGYDCGSEPAVFHNVLSNDLLHRIARIGAALQITLYPPPSQAGSE